MYAKCGICGKLVARGGASVKAFNTTNLVNHLKSKHCKKFEKFEIRKNKERQRQVQAHSHGGSVGSDELPSQTKGPLFYAKESIFYNKRYTFYNKDSLFTIKVHFFSIKGPLLVQLVRKRSTDKENKSPFLKKVHQHFIYVKGPIYIQNTFSFL